MRATAPATGTSNSRSAASFHDRMVSDMSMTVTAAGSTSRASWKWPAMGPGFRASRSPAMASGPRSGSTAPGCCAAVTAHWKMRHLTWMGAKYRERVKSDSDRPRNRYPPGRSA